MSHVGGVFATKPMHFHADYGNFSVDELLQLALFVSKPTEKELSEQIICLKQLQLLVKALGLGWYVSPFGSFANGFSSTGGDLDVTCFQEGVKEQDSHLAVKELRFKLLPLLAMHPQFEIVEEIWAARVPILKLRFDEAIDVDLSCHNPQALQNTHLLRAYANLNPKVVELVRLVKLWAKDEGISGAPEKHLSSYSITLMVLYYLQVEPTLAMPCIPTALFNHFGARPEVNRINWLCTLPLSKLFFGFLKFYISDFKWGTEVVSVRIGRRYSSSEVPYQQLQSRSVKRLHIEDPFLLSRNLNCVLSFENEGLLKDTLHKGFVALKAGGIPTAFVRILKLSDRPSSPVAANVFKASDHLPVSLNDGYEVRSTETGTDNFFQPKPESNRNLQPNDFLHTGTIWQPETFLAAVTPSSKPSDGGSTRSSTGISAAKSDSDSLWESSSESREFDLQATINRPRESFLSPLPEEVPFPNLRFRVLL